MKSMKKFLALALALALCFVMALPALATGDQATAAAFELPESGTSKLTIKSAIPGHKYSIYQIFYGDVSGTDDGETVNENAEGNTMVLSNVRYGLQYAGEGTKGALVPKTELDNLDNMKNNSKDIQDWADARLKEIVDGKVSAFKTGTMMDNAKELEFTDLPAGYYLVVDEGYQGEVPTEHPDYANMSALLVEVVGPTTMTSKVTTTEFDKTVAVKPADPDVDISELQYSEADQAKIGDTVMFKLEAKIPVADLAQYDYYTVDFQDKLSKGFDFDEDSVKVSVSQLDVENSTKDLTKSADYSWYDDNDDDEGALVEDKKATFIAQTGFGYKELESYNDKDVSEGEHAFSVEVANIFKQFENEKSELNLPTTGTIVVTLTYEAKLNGKADMTSSDGAETSNLNDAHLKYTNDPETGNKGGKTPDDKVFVYSFLLDITKVDSSDTDKKLGGAEFELTDDKGNKLQFIQNPTDGQYYLWDENVEYNFDTTNLKSTTTIISSSDEATLGQLKVNGLKAGTYILTETKAPTGFNICKPIKVEIKATDIRDTGSSAEMVDTSYVKLTLSSIPVTEGTDLPTTDPNEGKTDSEGTGLTVLNSKGTLLPSTGGIGTTIFYAVGGALVVGAGVLLFVRKRMGSKG